MSVERIALTVWARTTICVLPGGTAEILHSSSLGLPQHTHDFPAVGCFPRDFCDGREARDGWKLADESNDCGAGTDPRGRGP